jgi:hypothetical protein
MHDPLRSDAYREMGVDTLCTTDLGVGLTYDFLQGRGWDKPAAEYLNNPIRPEVEE